MKRMPPPSPVLASLRDKGLTAEKCDRRVEAEWQKPTQERTFAAIALWMAAAALLRGGDAARGYGLTKEAGKTVATLPPAVRNQILNRLQAHPKAPAQRAPQSSSPPASPPPAPAPDMATPAAPAPAETDPLIVDRMAVLERARAAFPAVFGVDAEVKPLTFAVDLDLASALAISLERVNNLMVWWTQQPAYLAALEQHKNRRWRLDGTYLTLRSARLPSHLRQKTPGVPTTPEDMAKREANLRICAERFPALFGAQVRPLAIGAGALLREALGLSETEATHLLRWWVSRRPYCEAMAEPGSQRYNLDGSIAEDVSEAHRQDARVQLARLRGERPVKAPRKANAAAEVRMPKCPINDDP
jgi:sRNA-binding protein